MSQETIRAAERAAGQVKTMSTYDPDSDQLHEECGIFGVWAPDRDVARLTYFGLRALQHRGQESAGIAVGDGGTVMVRKDLGLLDRVFSNADLSTLSGQLAVGHVRYGTAGAKSWEASQPHLSTINSVIIALAHNGTLVNTDELRRQLIELGVPFLSNSDSEVATKLIGYFTQRTGHLREGIRKTMELVRGGYAMTLINEQALYAFRDPHGIRPLVLGKLVDEGLDQADAASVSQLPSQDGAATVDATTHVTRAGGWVVASETCALDIVGAEYVRDVRPGEILRISAEGLVSEQGVLRPSRLHHERQERLCLPLRHGSSAGTRRARRGRPGHRRARLRPAACGGLFARERHSLWRGPHQEPLRGPYVYRAYAGVARHGRAHEA